MSILNMPLPLSTDRLKRLVHACLDPISSQNDLLLNVFSNFALQVMVRHLIGGARLESCFYLQYRWHSKTSTYKRPAQEKIFFQKGRKSANFCRLYPPSVIYLARQFSHFAQLLEVSDHTWRTARHQVRSA